ncbi:MAG: pyridoxamine 5'-phosphate oxidase [Bacteroidetes bacterium]|nr:pyridoxamine 5'-phosphate oxidase [Bacteroidota bacterium]MDA1336859.1 pyridoxamine 5'-phosphate oxidase [Bacteroidota bacterium]
MNKSLNSTRKDYQKGILDFSMLPANPFQLLQQWLDQAQQEDPQDFNAMCLSTVSMDGGSNARVVLLREVLSNGLRFYTNYKSNKGQELELNDGVSCLFFWPQMERQIRIRGKAKKSSVEVSDSYFASRPRQSQLGAWASKQSHVGNESDLLDRLKKLGEFHKDEPISRPDFWGGYDVFCTEIEFWQGRPSRLHQRVLYSLIDDAEWNHERLDP